MNEWGVFLAIAVILSFCLAVGRPLLALNTNLTTLNLTVKENTEAIRRNAKANEKQHEGIWAELDCHEGRILSLEQEKAR